MMVTDDSALADGKNVKLVLINTAKMIIFKRIVHSVHVKNGSGCGWEGSGVRVGTVRAGVPGLRVHPLRRLRGSAGAVGGGGSSWGGVGGGERRI